MNSAEVHDAAARAGLDEAKRAVWAEDDWDGGVQHCLDRIWRELTFARTVLDYGCGMGRMLKPLTAAVNVDAASGLQRLDLTGYDPSVAMLDRCREYIGRESGVRFAIEPPDEMFDLIYSIAVLQHLDLAEQSRALRWMATHSRTMIVQFVTYPAEVGDLSHPMMPWMVLNDLDRRALRSFSVESDDRFPTWRWVTAVYDR